MLSDAAFSSRFFSFYQVHLERGVRVDHLAAYVDEEMLVVGVMQPLLLHEGGVLDQPELVGGDGPSDPGRRGRGWRGGLGGGGQVEGTRGEGLHTERNKKVNISNLNEWIY